MSEVKITFRADTGDRLQIDIERRPGSPKRGARRPLLTETNAGPCWDAILDVIIDYRQIPTVNRVTCKICESTGSPHAQTLLKTLVYAAAHEMGVVVLQNN